MQRPTTPLLWLLAAQSVSLLPLLGIVPLWAFAGWLLVAVWYWQITTNRRRFPRGWQKVALSALTVAAVYGQFGRLFNLEAMVTVLVCAVALKLLELKSRRDHWLLLLLCYFLVAGALLFSQQLLDMLIALAQLAVIVSAQQALHRDRPRPGAMLRLTGVMALQSIPLMLALFFVFPRIAPLWSMPVPGKQAQTGMSDSLEFGDVASLSRSGELAFRVSFNGPVPDNSHLYWRGLVLEAFDGRRWTVAHWRDPLPRGRQPDAVLGAGPERSYLVTLEPGFHKWLYTLGATRIDRDDLRSDNSYIWRPRRPLSGRFSYQANSRLSATLPEPQPHTLIRNRFVPPGGNPQTLALAAQWRALPDNAARLAAAQRFFTSQPFVYTLNPPLLGDNNVDDFLFSARQGFCEHYAGSLAYLMRAAGVPARLVVGYQGGEFNDRDQYLLVHQSDAHAWVEVWLPEQGWVRVDPTSWVAPNRIQLGADALLRQDSGYLSDSPLSLRRFAWANKLRYFVDSINYAWARWVINYDDQRQWQLLQGLLGSITPVKLVMMVVLAGMVPLLWLALVSLRPRSRRGSDPLSRAYLRCCQSLARYGHVRTVGETPEAFLRRVAQGDPRWQTWLAKVTRCYTAAEYQRTDEAERKRLLQDLRKLRRPNKN